MHKKQWPGSESSCGSRLRSPNKRRDLTSALPEVWTLPACRSALTLVSKKTSAPGNALVVLDAFRRRAVDDAEDAAALLGLGDDDLYGVRGGTEDAADLGNALDRLTDVDREGIDEEDDERVTGADGLRVADGELLKLGLGAGVADEAVAGGFAKREPKLNSRHGADEGLVNVLDGLDEVRLAEDAAAEATIAWNALLTWTACPDPPR